MGVKAGEACAGYSCIAPKWIEVLVGGCNNIMTVDSDSRFVRCDAGSMAGITNLLNSCTSASAAGSIIPRVWLQILGNREATPG